MSIAAKVLSPFSDFCCFRCVMLPLTSGINYCFLHLFLLFYYWIWVSLKVNNVSNFIKTFNFSLRYCDITIFKIALVNHLELKKTFWSRDCYQVQQLLPYTKFHQKSDNFLSRYGDITISKMAAVRHFGLVVRPNIACGKRISSPKRCVKFSRLLVL